MAELNIGSEFSLDPCGRFYSDDTGSSGEQFREEFLLPRLSQLEGHDKLRIILDDGVESYGSSFLTEGFAGVVKFGHMTSDDLLKKIELVVRQDEDFEFYKEKIIQYIKEAKYNSKSYVSTKI